MKFCYMQSTTCLNCEKPIIAGQNFCAACGQKAHIHRLNLHEVGHDALHYFTHADKGIFSLLRELVLRPGKVAREYIEGKRKKYFPPVNFFFIVTAISVLSAGIIASATKKSAENLPVIEHTTARSAAGQKNMRAIKTKAFITKYPNAFPISSTPLIAFLLWLFYIRGRYNFTEHLVANMYITGFLILLYSLVVTPLSAALHLQGMNYLLGSYLIFEIIYRSIFYYFFINRRTKRSLLWTVFVSIAVVMFWALLSNFVIRGYIAGWFS